LSERVSPRLRAVLWAGLAAGLGDSALAVALYRVPLSVIYRSVASGLLGGEAYRGGLATALLGLVLHFLIATTAAGVYAAAASRFSLLGRRPVPSGLAFGVAVYLVMKYVVVAHSAVPRQTPFDPAAMLGHACLVGLPIALVIYRGAPVEARVDSPRVP
jgi:hypothetical protein